MDPNIVSTTDVIRKRKAALKTSRPSWAFQWFDQFAGFVIGQWLHGNARDVPIGLF
jgi:hypothetical protein